MTKLNIKKGDNVVVIAGKEKGKTGKVLGTIASSNRVIVEGVNIVTKHQKPRSQKDKGGLIKKPAPIDISNVMILCPVCGKASRIARKEIDGKNVRVCKKCDASLDKGYTKPKKETKKAVGAKKEVAEKPVKEEKTTEKKTVAKKATAKTTEKVAVKKSTAKTSTTTARRSTNRGK